MDEPDHLPLGAMTQEDFLQQDARGRNVLHLAFEKENSAHLVEAILQKAGVYQLLVQQEYEQWQTPLHLAANHPDINLIIIIYKSISIEQFSKAASVRD